MKSVISFIFCITINLLICHGQNIMTIKVDSSKYWSVSSGLIELRSFEIQNNTKDTLIMWIDSTRSEPEEIHQAIIRYYRKNRIAGLGNLTSYFFESQVNWETYHPSVYYTFFTIIPPKKSFRVIVEEKKEFDLGTDYYIHPPVIAEEKTEFDPNWIVCCSKQTILSELPWFFGHNFRHLCYPSDVIVIR